jgi:antitoxin Phd
MASWKLEDAKNQFSRLVQAARRHGPQMVTRHGRETVVVMSVEHYRRLARRQENLAAFLRRSPLADALGAGELELVRARDLPRDIPL